AAGIVVVDRREMLSVPHVRGMSGQLREPDLTICFEDSADLIPRRVHVLLLVLLNYPSSEPRAHSVTWIEIQLVNPVLPIREILAVRLEQQALGERRPRAVQRRRDDRVLAGAR